MAEFKISPNLSSEVESLKNAGSNLAQSYKEVDKSDIKTLKTATKYIEQQNNIQKLMKAYRSLLIKDSNDLNEMIKEAEEMDESISASTK